MTGGTSPSPVIRCELDGPDPLRSVETNCQPCTSCLSGGCPTGTGRWYSDSFTVSLPSCAFTGGTPPVAAFLMNAGVRLVLAKFEVCSNPTSFNATYEAAKAAQAG